MKFNLNIKNTIKYLPNQIAQMIFKLRGKKAWTFGYYSYKRKYLLEILKNENIMRQFREESNLNAGYGIGLDERVVEYPWVISKLNEETKIILDAGSTFNHDFIIEQPVLKNKNLHILTLAPENRNYLSKGISYLFEDLRAIPIKNDFYDIVVSISTLEHIGFDNTYYFQNNKIRENNSFTYISAIREIKRVLKPGGDFIFTVPYGKFLDSSTQLVFNENLINEIIELFDPGNHLITYYKYNQRGWQISNKKDCRDAEFSPWIASPKKDRTKKYPIPQDRAAAARAVACAILKKRI